MAHVHLFRLRNILIYLLAALFAGAAAFTHHFFLSLDQPYRDSHAPANVVIPRGWGARRIALLLENYGLIPNQWTFLAAAKMEGAAGGLQAGEYDAATALSPRQWVNTLRQGERITHRLTIPEGWNTRQIAGQLEKQSLLTQECFLAVCQDPSFLRSQGIRAEEAEGYLFPETYSFERPVSATGVAEVMIDEFQRRSRQLGGISHDQLTLASIIQKEVARPEDMKKAAAVFLNRLRLKRPLESDATTLYAMKRAGEQFETLDTDFDSPYNTYKQPGLPPGPVCNPGIEAMRAVIEPAKGDWLYFLSDKHGNLYFSRTHREHVRLKHRLRKQDNY